MSSTEEINHKFDTLLQRLPHGWQELAVETRAFTRARQIKSPKDLLRAVFAYAVADYSLREVAAVLTHEQKWISDQGVHARLAKCVTWLETLLAQLLFDKAARVEAATCRRLKIVDATVLNCPAARGTDYRLHLCYEAISQSSCGVKLTDVKGAERFTHFEYEASDIVLGDRIYGKARHLIKVKEQGADVVVRQSLQQLRLYTSTGEVIEWQELLIKAQRAGRLLLEAYVRDEEGNQMKVFIVGQRLSEAEIEYARRQIKRSAYDKGHKTRAATLLACEWLTVLTTIAPTELNAELVLQLYRVRWQIELSFKRLKTILRLGRIRAGRGSQLARVHLLAKMIYALLIETVAVERLGSHWTQMTTARRGTWFRVWKMLRDEFTESIIGTVEWRDGEWRLMLKVIWERRRKRKLQRLSKPLLRWLQDSAASELMKNANQPSVTHLAA
ncbi:MAG: transposase [Acidobacteriota bacterium]|nr:transposase [Acidobacteriota bacterium]